MSNAKPAFKARARKLLRAAAPYCTPGDSYDRSVRDAADWVVASMKAGHAPSTTLRLVNDLERVLGLAAKAAA